MWKEILSYWLTVGFILVFILLFVLLDRILLGAKDLSVATLQIGMIVFVVYLIGVVFLLIVYTLLLPKSLNTQD